MPIPLTVTGVEATGQMFRERTLVLGLNGRECQYQSKHEVCVDSVVLLALDEAGSGRESRPIRGRVKSLQPLKADRHRFRISVELETPQTTRVVPHDQENQAEKQDIRVPAASGMQDLAARILAMSSELAKSAVADAISQQMETLKRSLSHEMKESMQATAASAMGPIIHDAVKQQTTQQYQAIVQALQADLPDQLAGRLAESDQLRNCFDGMKDMMAQRLSELSQTVSRQADQELHTRIAALRQSYDGAIAEMQERIGEVAARAQESRRQIDEADRIVANRLDEHCRLRLDALSAELNQRLDRAVAEGAARWVSSVQEQMDPYMKRIDERLAILASGLELAQMQQDKLTELSRTAAANFEKDMRAIFLRYSASA